MKKNYVLLIVRITILAVFIAGNIYMYIQLAQLKEKSSQIEIPLQLMSETNPEDLDLQAKINEAMEQQRQIYSRAYSRSLIIAIGSSAIGIIYAFLLIGRIRDFLRKQ